MTLQTPTLPQLPLSLREHKTAIALRWSTITLTSCILPIVLFYALWFGTSLKHQIVFAIPAAIFGVVTLIQLVHRTWKLTIRDPKYRPIDSPRSALDFFHWGFLIGFVIVTVEISIGTALKQPLVRLLAMPAPTLMFEVAILIAICDLFLVTGIAVPFRISSVRKGDLARPGIYTIVEDIVAVDGAVGLQYRLALDARYKASGQFRTMLYRLSVFWSVSLLIFGGAVTAIVWTVPEEVAYGLGWGLPFVHAGIMAFLTTKYVQSSLLQEKQAWVENVGANI